MLRRLGLLIPILSALSLFSKTRQTLTSRTRRTEAYAEAQKRK